MQQHTAMKNYGVLDCTNEAAEIVEAEIGQTDHVQKTVKVSIFGLKTNDRVQGTVMAQNSDLNPKTKKIEYDDTVQEA